jgi:hypothetical protein
MAFGFNGFQVGKEIGAGLARPVDFSPLSNFLLKQQIQQKEIHQRMLEAVSKNIQSFNPKGVMQQDMPIVMQKYDRWRSLEMAHPEAVFNPRNKWFKEIDDARKDLYSTTSELIDGAKQIQSISHFLATNDAKGRHLTPEAAQKWDFLISKGWGAYKQKYPNDLNLEQALLPNIQESAQQVQKDIDNAMKWGTSKKVVATEGDMATEYTTSGNYGSMIPESVSRFNNLDSTPKRAIENEYNTMPQEEKDYLVDQIRDKYLWLPNDVISSAAKNSIAKFDITDPATLFAAKNLLHNAPLKGNSKPSGEYNLRTAKEKQAFSEKMQTLRYRQAAERLGLSEEEFKMKKWKDFIKEVTDSFNAKEQMIYKKGQGSVPTPKESSHNWDSSVQNVVARRKAAGMFVPPNLSGVRDKPINALNNLIDQSLKNRNPFSSEQTN